MSERPLIQTIQPGDDAQTKCLRKAHTGEWRFYGHLSFRLRSKRHITGVARLAKESTLAAASLGESLLNGLFDRNASFKNRMNRR